MADPAMNSASITGRDVRLPDGRMGKVVAAFGKAGVVDELEVEIEQPGRPPLTVDVEFDDVEVLSREVETP